MNSKKLRNSPRNRTQKRYAFCPTASSFLVFSCEARKASALLLSFFLMSILVLVAISVSILVVKDLSTVRTIVGGTQAYYAAEGVTELGLQDLKDNLPGYEPSYSEIRFLDSVLATLVGTARSDSKVVPCENQGDEWHALGLNESVQIPLFAQTLASGDVEPDLGSYMNFYVSFYAGQEDGEVDATSILEKDVLRWKILGRTGTEESPGVTEAMSEYIPLYDGNGIDYNSKDSPTQFGPAAADGTFDGFKNGKFANSSSALFPAYPISQFLESHVYNYLVLTNIITESTPNQVIFYQFTSLNMEPVCEYVNLAATGSSTFGSAQQDLDTLVKEGESLPVFDFVIYHTNGADAAP